MQIKSESSCGVGGLKADGCEFLALFLSVSFSSHLIRSPLSVFRRLSQNGDDLHLDQRASAFGGGPSRVLQPRPV